MTSVSAAQAQVSQINAQLQEIKTAKDGFKKQAMAAKEAGDRETALVMVKYIKTCDKLEEEVIFFIIIISF